MERTPGAFGIIGFGEAAQAFAVAGKWRARVYDRLTDREATRAAIIAAYRVAGVWGCETASDAVAGAEVVLSLVTADQALSVAQAVGGALAPGALYLDMNSVAPVTKRAASKAVEASGASYVDVAVMSPVDPAGLATPLLLSGPSADAAAQTLEALGFSQVRVVGVDIGRASSIKMIRSVMIKGIEALSAECALGAAEAGVLDEVLDSLDAGWPGADWRRRLDYNLDRMLVHGLRRAAEMEEVVRTLDDLGVGSVMSRGTALRQGDLGERGLRPPPQGLAAKIAALRDPASRAAA